MRQLTIKQILGSTKLFTQNSKIKKTGKELGVRIFNFGIPAYKSRTGKVICPFALLCVAYCYAQKGSYVWSNVEQAFEKRYQVTKHSNFIEYTISEIKRIKADFIRIHDSGDFYSPKYIQSWFQIIRSCPQTKFYAYTKSFPLFVNLDIPDNLCLIFSQGSKNDELFLNDDYRHAKIFNTYDEMNKENYIDCSSIDLFATKWYTDSNKIGLIFH